jgi:hypothetical protein
MNAIASMQLVLKTKQFEMLSFMGWAANSSYRRRIADAFRSPISNGWRPVPLLGRRKALLIRWSLVRFQPVEPIKSIGYRLYLRRFIALHVTAAERFRYHRAMAAVVTE